MTEHRKFQAAIAVARASTSPMERAAAALDPLRYKVFCAAYESMRVIDDYVDDAFLALPPAKRAAERATARRVVADWRTAATARLATGSLAEGPAGFADVMEALEATHAVAKLDPGPWDRLADAMTRDVDERPMPDWDAFLAYAEGATAAPAAVFVEILALRPGPDGRLESQLAGKAVGRSRNAAILLYLVHIMRDLSADAQQGAVLLTLPATLFAELGMDAEGFATQAADDPALVAKARAAIAEYAERFLLPALAELTALDRDLGPEDGAVLRGLCAPYIARYETFADSL